MADTSRIRKSVGSRCGNTKRVTAAAAMSPAIEYKPSCANPGKLDSSSEENPTMEVSTPSRMVGHKSRTQSVATVWLFVVDWRDWTNR